jgi:signal transduction histidine kinase
MEADPAQPRGRIANPALLGRSLVCDRRCMHPWKRLPAPDGFALAIRGTLFSLCLVTGAAASGTQHLIWFAPLAASVVLVSASVESPRRRLLLGIIDGVVAAVVVVGSGSQSSPLLPYLIAPPVVTAARTGEKGSVPPAGAAALVLLVGAFRHEVSGNLRAYSSAAAEWVVLALVTGLIAGRVHSHLRRESDRDQGSSYAAAYRLLSQLRTVARHLSGGLDPVTIGHGLLTAARDITPYDRGAVYARSPGGRLVPLAFFGADRIDWDVSMSSDNAFADAWASQRPVLASRAHAEVGEPRHRAGSSIALPLRVGVRTIGVLGLEADVPGQLTSDVIGELQRRADDSSLRLETALLFDEVREVATVEERRRLAREIHDGIAQELASFGYLVDALAHEADVTAPALAGELRSLRRELTRVITELRLSIFDLRSEVDAHGGLGAALSEYVRSVGASSGFTVHLSLAETPHRLPAETEAELLRIAQEAITNARKHAQAENLWVTCEVDPPAALLRIEDDGRGLHAGRDDSFGIEIMRERAGRLRAEFEIRPRAPAGTCVEVALRVRTSDAARHA